MENKLQSIVQQVLTQVPTLLAGIPETGFDYKRSYIEGDISSIFGEGWRFKIQSKPSIIDKDKHWLSIDVIEPEGEYMCSTLLLQAEKYEDIEEFLHSPKCEQEILRVIPRSVNGLQDSLYDARKYLHR